MRVAFLADIHGNLPAFEAALSHIQQQHVDQIIIAGDIVIGSPDSLACWQLAQSLGCPIIRGNHEGYLLEYSQPDAPAEQQSQQFAPVHWAVAQCSPADLQAMAALPMALRPAIAPGVLVVHASARSDRDTITAYTPESELAAMFDSTEEPLIIRAHNHVGAVRLWGERKIVTIGSVGLALDGHATVQYLIIEQQQQSWKLEHHATAYDLQAALRRFYTTGYLEAAWPMAELFRREVATGSHQIVPFLRFYRGLQAREPISLEQALTRFLALKGLE